jgi:hypothetical protein
VQSSKIAEPLLIGPTAMKSSASAAGTYSAVATNSASRILIIMMNSASSGSGVHVSDESEESKKECGAGVRREKANHISAAPGNATAEEGEKPRQPAGSGNVQRPPCT